MASAGLLSAFYGVAVGITQANPKTVLAYSSISQMGLIATVAGMGLANGDHGTALVVALCRAPHFGKRCTLSRHWRGRRHPFGSTMACAFPCGCAGVGSGWVAPDRRRPGKACSEGNSRGRRGRHARNALGGWKRALDAALSSPFKGNRGSRFENGRTNWSRLALADHGVDG